MFTPGYKPESLQASTTRPLSGHAAIHAAGEIEIVRGDQGREAGLLHEALERCKDMLAGHRIEVAVGSSASRSEGEFATARGNRHALLLAAREFAGAMVEPMAQAEESRAHRGRGPPLLSERPAIRWGITTFSMAENSGMRWWNW